MLIIGLAEIVDNKVRLTDDLCDPSVNPNVLISYLDKDESVGFAIICDNGYYSVHPNASISAILGPKIDIDIDDEYVRQKVVEWSKDRKKFANGKTIWLLASMSVATETASSRMLFGNAQAVK